MIEEHFSDDSIEFTANEVFNYFVYEDETEVKTEAVIDAIIKLISQDVSFISFDPKRVSVLILKTKSPTAIRALINQLFIRDHSGLWNSYDTITAISYLIQSEFRHIDLITVLCKNNEQLKRYYQSFCCRSFAKIFNDQKLNSYCDIIGKDWKSFFLFFMYRIENSKRNNLAKFAFYKNFFDRFTANMAYATHYNVKAKRPEYMHFYNEKEHRDFYSSIPGAEKVIKNAHKLRNANPLSHASAELVDRSNTAEDIENSIVDMARLIEEFRARNINQ